jgi:hypothetical protein
LDLKFEEKKSDFLEKDNFILLLQCEAEGVFKSLALYTCKENYSCQNINI